MTGVDNAEQKRIFHAILTSFDKYAKRDLERIYAKWKSMTAEEKNKLKEVDMLLSKRAFIPGFYRHVLKKVVSNQKLRRQQRVLAPTFILSLLTPEGIKTKDIIDRTKKHSNNLNLDKKELVEPYTRRSYQRLLNDYYQDAFFKLKSTNENRMDDRFIPYSSVFSSTELPITPYSEFAGRQYSTQVLHTFSNQFKMTWISFSVTMQLITPEVLEDIQSVNEACKEAITRELKEIERRLHTTKNKYRKDKLKKRKKVAVFVFSEFNNFSPIFYTFYFHFSSILAWKWLQSRRSTKRKELLAKGFPLRYTTSEIANARKLLLCQLTSEDYVNDWLMRALQHYAFVTKSFQNFKDCVEASKLPELDCGILFENVATLYRERQNYKLMLVYLKYALEYYQKAENNYRICVALKNLGEAEWRLGFMKRGLKRFKEAEKQGKVLTDLTQRFGVLWNLACSFRRLGNANLELDFLVKCLKILPETETDKILEIEQRLQQLDLVF